MKRFVLPVLLIVALIAAAGFVAQMALAQGVSPQSGNATVSVTVPEYIEILDLDAITLTAPVTIPGAATGSDADDFQVASNVAANITNSITAFSPVLAATPTVTIVPTTITAGTTTNCTLDVSVNIAITDAVGAHTATLTVTVTKPV